MPVIDNGTIRCSLDAAGRLLELTNLAIGHNYASGEAFWRLICARGPVRERAVDGTDFRPAAIVADGAELRLEYDLSFDAGGPAEIGLTVKLGGDGAQLRVGFEIDNRSADITVRELQLAVRGVALASGQRLIWSRNGGEQFRDLPGEIGRHHSQYKASDHRGVEMSLAYPHGAATNCYALAGATEGLYLGSHDPDFRITLHLLRQRGELTDAGLVRYPFLPPGDRDEVTGLVLAPYAGSWHEAARLYRRWADAWFRPRPKPAHIAGMNGWQRIIMRHQYGEIMFRHDQLPEILRDGLEAGIDTLFMFGWHREGHDAGYPDYAFDEEQGGRDALRRRIGEFRSGGGKVLLYYNGRLIDMNSEYYRRNGRQVSVKRENGTEHQEFYPFGGDGTWLRMFPHRSFVTACLGHDAWFRHLKTLCDRALDLGADGVFFDQLGFGALPCWDETHGHPVPFVNTMAVYAEVIGRLREYVRSRNPEFSLGIELLSDVTANQVDYIHSLTGACQTAPGEFEPGGRPALRAFPEWFRFIFPEVILSDREIRDDTDIDRRVNLCLLRGFRSDVEIYRCRATIAAAPHYREYLAAADRLRARYRELLLEGTFRDTEGVTADNPAASVAVFTAGNRLAVLLTQSHLEACTVRLTVPGYRYLECDGLNRFAVEPGAEDVAVELGRDGLAVVILEQSE